MVASGGVGEYLDTIQTHIDVWSCWSEELLAQLNPDAGIER